MSGTDKRMGLEGWEMAMKTKANEADKAIVANDIPGETVYAALQRRTG